MRQVFISTDEYGNVVAECPGLPGCVATGRTRDEAVGNLRDVMADYISGLEFDGLPVPIETVQSLSRVH